MYSTVYFDFEINGETFEFEVEAIFSRHTPAKTSGDPNSCHDAEGGEIEDKEFAHVITTTVDGKNFHTTKPCSENVLYELLCAENEGWTFAKAEEHIDQKLHDNVSVDDEPDYEQDYGY